MSSLLAGAFIVLMLIMANVVGAGVFMVLGPLALELPDEDLQILAMCVVGALSVGAALCFINGILRAVVMHLQSRPKGQRGG